MHLCLELENKFQQSTFYFQYTIAPIAEELNRSLLLQMAVTHGKFLIVLVNLIFRENSNPSLIKMTDFYGRSLDSGSNSGTN